MDYKQLIDKVFFTGRLRRNVYQKFIKNLYKYNNITNYLYSLYNSNNIKELLYRLHNNDFKIHRCKECGNPIEYFSSSNFCSNNCRRKSQVRNTKVNLLLKYGEDNVAKIHTVKEKIIQTNINKYGVKFPLQNDNIKEKQKQTLINKYGVDNCSKVDEVKEKIKNTKINKYGYQNSFSNREILNKAILNSTSEEANEKRKKTLLDKYGVDNIFKDKSRFNYIQQIENGFKTKLINNTFNTSKPEIESYDILKQKYPDVIRQYKSDKYPFACDFYIPNLDLYIECNYHWTHGSKPYEGTNEDDLMLEQWKNKNTKFYNNAINCWTIRDVKKRNIAKQNNLNYLEFWDINELKNWLDY